ncbi:2987_t:CDS:2, partial [Funneliformis geosporum]
MASKTKTIYLFILFLFIIDCRALTDNAEKVNAILGQSFKRSTINEKFGDDIKFKRDGLIDEVIHTESPAYSISKRQANDDNSGNK